LEFHSQYFGGRYLVLRYMLLRVPGLLRIMRDNSDNRESTIRQRLAR
jgi:hypothetical protein